MRTLSLRLLAAGGAVVALTACGAGSSRRSTTSRSTTTVGRHTVAGEATTADGRYVVTLAVGGAPSPGDGTTCVSPPAPGMVRLAVALTVKSSGAPGSVPSPPLRVELANGDRREPVLLGEPGGACSFTPQAEIRPGAGVTFFGSTPDIDARAAPGTAGRVEVAISENAFSLVLPVP